MERRAIWANRYAIFDEIASGAMATVYVAGRLGDGRGRRIVAVKKLAEDFAKEPEFLAMFLDEARLAARVRHPNVIETFQVLRVPGSLAIVMELVVGASLAELLRASRERGEAVALPIVGAVLTGALHGLHAAHEAKDELGKPFDLVHRDVSPGNILVGRDGVTRVIDFGIAKAAGRLQVTEAGMTRGNASYMSPEQLLGKKVDRRSDIYAAGVVLWETLVGKQLFPVSSDTGMLGKRAAGLVVPTTPSSINRGIPLAVDDIVMRALASDPEVRFPTAHDLAAAIEGTLGAASPEEIARWVEDLARPKLLLLGAKVRQVEQAFERGELEAPSAPAAGDAGWSTSLVVDAPNLDLPPSQRTSTPPAAPAVPAPRASVPAPLKPRVSAPPPVPQKPRVSAPPPVPQKPRVSTPAPAPKPSAEQRPPAAARTIPPKRKEEPVAPADGPSQFQLVVICALLLAGLGVVYFLLH